MSRKNPWCNEIDRAAMMRGMKLAAKKRKERAVSLDFLEAAMRVAKAAEAALLRE